MVFLGDTSSGLLSSPRSDLVRDNKVKGLGLDFFEVGFSVDSSGLVGGSSVDVGEASDLEVPPMGFRVIGLSMLFSDGTVEVSS